MPFKSNACYNNHLVKGSMVFVSQNKDRKCKWCDKPPKENIQIENGKPRKKGYYRTCGSKECLRKQYDDIYICISKGKLNNPIDFTCACCGEEFKGSYGNHRRYCSDCVPNNAWRGRAARYGVGKKQWDKMLKKQSNACALCNRNPEVVDHCHKSGKVRGLLCNKCNGVIKLMDMKKEYIDRVIKYTGGKYESIS